MNQSKSSDAPARHADRTSFVAAVMLFTLVAIGCAGPSGFAGRGRDSSIAETNGPGQSERSEPPPPPGGVEEFVLSDGGCCEGCVPGDDPAGAVSDLF